VHDEVITFRLGTAGRQGELGIEPDLTMFGKLIGGGFPVGAVGGRRDVLAQLDPAVGKAFHSGTYNANPVTMAAGTVSVRELTAERISRMAELGSRLVAALYDAAARLGLPFSITRVGSLMNVYLSAEPPPPGAVRGDSEMMKRFHLACLNHGLMIAPRGMLCMSTVLNAADVDEIADRAGAALADLAAELS
jgi:glutamate-1-semialdehyde 2,1-aminomutase